LENRMSKPEDFKFDSRVRDRLLRSRVLSSADVQRHVEQLPDLDGQYEVMNDTPQPALAPPRSEVHEEPLVFDGIRRLQALADVSAPAPAPRYVAPAAAPAPSLPSYREPEPRALGTPLRSALMESEISGVGAGAVSAALGAMAAEARNASGYGVSPAIQHTPVVTQAPVTQQAPVVPPPAIVQQIFQPAAVEAEPPTPVTLRSEASPQAPIVSSPAKTEEETDEDEDDEDEDDDDADDTDEADEDQADESETDEDEDEDDEDDEDEEESADASAAAISDPDREDLA
jgi:hypothetical protein